MQRFTIAPSYTGRVRCLYAYFDGWRVDSGLADYVCLPSTDAERKTGETDTHRTNRLDRRAQSYNKKHAERVGSNHKKYTSFCEFPKHGLPNALGPCVIYEI